MYNIVDLSDQRLENDPDDVVRLRIEAKVKLWTFFEESQDDLLKAYSEPLELAKEIMGTCIWQLHPHYTGPEIMEETRLVLQSLQVALPANYAGIFASAFQRIVIGKMKQILEHRKKSK